MNTVDLHTHSTYSDGTFTPTELIKYGKDKGLIAIAITDHDTLSGIKEAKEAGKKYNIQVIGGIEFSTSFENTEIHIVGLFLDENCDIINNRLRQLQENREFRNIEMIKKLQSLGLNITYNDVMACAKGNVVTRAHFAKALVDTGCCQSKQECFDRYIGAGKPGYIERQVLDYKETISIINEGGGISVLAHPLLYKLSNSRLEYMVGCLAKAGLKGIEAYYSTHSPSETKYIKFIAQQNQLLLSGGSDFHGENKPKLDLAVGYGNLAVPVEVLDKMKGALL